MAYVCPYFTSYNNKRRILNCSGIKFPFHNRIHKLEYCGKHCENISGWKNCTIAKDHQEREQRERESREDDPYGED